ncbi:hypothetical protein WMY93_021488 [Mugilogobius chulae]|uniref:DDE Tnp4 domain-containing protein n=1 Tax=Mugilogobius chulae TaxID=88201 RepID=A0AAW0NN33_9GOBI
MSAEKMDELLSIVGPDLTRQTTNYRASIEPKQRLAVALRYLASGDSLMSLSFSYRLGHSTVVESVHMVYAAIERTMLAQCLPVPTEETWTAVANSFWTRWNFPNCLGALDGKLVNIVAPAHSGSQYFDYKKNFSLSLMALVDAECRFLVIQMGDYGRSSDGGVFATSDLGRGMESGTLHVPASVPLPGAPHLGPAPFVMVGDAAYPLKTYLMRPYAVQNLNHDKRIFNYRLSRARMAVERTFGILSSRWRILLRDINLTPKHVDTLVVAACILHNFLHNPRENQAWLDDFEEQGQHMEPAGNMGPRRGTGPAYATRELYTTYFNSPAGSVAWQERMI